MCSCSDALELDTLETQWMEATLGNERMSEWSAGNKEENTYSSSGDVGKSSNGSSSNGNSSTVFVDKVLIFKIK